MSSPIQHPATPIISPIPLRPDVIVSTWLDDLDVPRDSSSGSSTSICECCASPPACSEPRSGTNPPAAPVSEPGEDELDVTLQQLLLSSLEIQSVTLGLAQATAVVPNHPRVTDSWLLIYLLCHRIFAAFGEKGAIHNLKTYFHAYLRPGDILVINARRVVQGALVSFDATISTDYSLVATGSALHHRFKYGSLTPKPWFLRPNKSAPSSEEP
ncbi:hypothetical protein BBP40_002145 [Aspergillus hancockii]|nr:hypothetical protein BBP40_002145 [Aspergillus hancockii]